MSSDNGPLSRRWLLDQLIRLHEEAYDGHSFYFFVNKEAALSGSRSHLGTALGPEKKEFVFLQEKFLLLESQVVFDQGENRHVIKKCDGLRSIRLTQTEVKKDFGDVTSAGYLKLKSNRRIDCLTSESKVLSFLAMNIESPLDSKSEKISLQEGARLSEFSGVDYLRIGSFPEPMTANQMKIVSELKVSDKPLVVDVRGVGGGSPPFNVALEKALFTKKQTCHTSTNINLWSFLKLIGVSQVFESMRYDVVMNIGLESKERTRRLDALDARILEWKKSTSFYIDLYSLKNINDVYQDEYKNYIEGERVSERTQPIVVLIDRKCGSQCEFLVALLRHHPNAILVGLPTAGRANFANNGALFLPNSKISFIPSAAITRHMPKLEEGEGVWPDQLIVSDKPREIAIRIARQQ